MRGGTFHGRGGKDEVARSSGGIFFGDTGSDHNISCVDSPPAGYDSVEGVAKDACSEG
jgi:hypothetical protein